MHESVHFVAASAGARLVTAHFDSEDQQDPVFFTFATVVAWEVQVDEEAGDKRAVYAAPVTIGEQDHRTYRLDCDHAVVFADGHVESTDGSAWPSLEDWQRWAAERLLRLAARRSVEQKP